MNISSADAQFNQMNISSADAQSGQIEAKIRQFVRFSTLHLYKYCKLEELATESPARRTDSFGGDTVRF